MRNAIHLGPFAAGACIASAATGASSALTSTPSWVVIVTGAIVAASFVHGSSGRSTSRWCAASLCGVAFALALPTSPPPAPGVVSTRPVVTDVRSDLFDALAKLDSDPSALLGTRIAVTGAWAPASRDDLATVSRRIVSCCAADAVDVGFDVRLERDPRLGRGAWVRVEGVVGERVVDGDVRYVLEHSTVRGLEDGAPNSR